MSEVMHAFGPNGELSRGAAKALAAWVGGGGWEYVRLDPAATTTGTASVDTGLQFTPEPDASYEFDATLVMQSAALTTGVQFGLKWPTGLTVSVAQAESPISATSAAWRYWGAPTAQKVAATAVPVANENLFGSARGLLETGPPPVGALVITLASEVSGSEVRLMPGSFVRWRRMR